VFYDIPFPTCLLPMHRNCMAWIAHQGSPPRSSLFQAEEAGRLKDNVIERQPIVRIRICKYSLSTSRSAQRSQQHQHAAAQVANQPSAQSIVHRGLAEAEDIRVQRRAQPRSAAIVLGFALVLVLGEWRLRWPRAG